MPANRVVLVAPGDLEPVERGRLDASDVLELGPGEPGWLETMLPPAGRVSLHIDLGVLDPS